MFKKTLVFCLAVCMLSVNVFAGTAMLSMAADYSAIQGPVKEETVTVKPDVVRVVENESAGTQTIYYWDEADRPSAQYKSNTKASTSTYAAAFKAWYYMRVPVNGLTSVNAATVTAQLRFNTGSTTFYIRALDKDVWDDAVSNLTSGGSKTISSTDTDLHDVPAGEALWNEDNDGNTAGLATYDDIASDALTAYINEGAADNYIYLAVHAASWRADKDGGATTLNSWSFTLTGTKPIEGLSASIVQEETVNVKPDVVRVVEDESAGTQTIYYWDEADRPSAQYKSNTKASTSTYAAAFKAWYYMRVPVNGLTSVNAATVTAQLRFNTGSTTFYIRALDKDVWDDAVSNLTSGSSKTISSTDTDLHDVPAGEALWNEDNDGNTAGLATYNDIASDALTAYINEGAADNYIYLAVHATSWRADKDGGATTLNSWSFTLTGTKPVEGTSINGNDFTYGVTVEAGETVRLVVGIYGAGDAFLGAEVSDAETSDGETVIELPVSLSTYTGATYIKAYMWESGTLVPYFAPIVKEVA